MKINKLLENSLDCKEFVDLFSSLPVEESNIYKIDLCMLDRTTIQSLIIDRSLNADTCYKIETICLDIDYNHISEAFCYSQVIRLISQSKEYINYFIKKKKYDNFTSYINCEHYLEKSLAFQRQEAIKHAT